MARKRRLDLESAPAEPGVCCALSPCDHLSPRRLLCISTCLSLLLAGTSLLQVLRLNNPSLPQDRYLNSNVVWDPQLSLRGTSLTDSGQGYDSAGGTEALCWKGMAARYNFHSNSNSTTDPFEGFHMWGRTNLLPDCSSQRLQSQVISNSSTLLAGETYQFSVHLSADLSLLLREGEQDTASKLWTANNNSVAAAVKIILCDLETTGLCTPFIPDWERVQGPTGAGFVESAPALLPPFLASSLKLEGNLTIPLKIPNTNTTVNYVAIAALQMYSQDSPSPTYYRWDMANAIPNPKGGRIFRVQPQLSSNNTSKNTTNILRVSPTVELVSYVAIGMAGGVQAILLLATIYYRHSQVLRLTQGTFLVAFNACALVAIASSLFLNPKSDIHCQLSYPMLFISLQIMYGITAGRMWRIQSILSPILQHRDTDTRDTADTRDTDPEDAMLDGSQHSRNWTMTSSDKLQRLIRQVSQKLPGANLVDLPRKEQGLRRTIPNWHLALAVALCALPQIVIQIISLVRQPQAMEIQYTDDGTTGRTHCAVKENCKGSRVNIVVASLVCFVLLLVLLVAVAFHCRKLPSVGVLNETRQIYDTTLTAMLLLVLAVGVVLLTNNPTTSPDVEYVIGVATILWSTLNSTLRIMQPKLLMAYRGQTVVVSALIQEHHGKIRQKEESKMKELTAKAHAFQKSVTPLVADRTQNGEFVEQCFVAEEAIDALLERNVVGSRWEGIQLGRLLEREVGLFMFAGGVQPDQFQDGVVLYRFRAFGGRTLSRSFLMPPINSRQQLSITIDEQCRPTLQVKSASVSDVDMLSRRQLQEKADGFKAYIDVRDRRHNMRKFTNCFVASEAVDSMVFAGLAQSREGAVKLGLRFQKELRLFRHVTNTHDFQDKWLFFRYTRSSQLAPETLMLDESEELTTGGIDEEEGSMRLESIRSEIMRPESMMLSGLDLDSCIANRRKNLSNKAKEFVRIVTVRDRKYHLRKWPKVFVGAEAVDAMVFHGMANTRWEAVQIGRTLARDLGLFKHVVNDHAFSDEFLFFRYVNENVPNNCLWDDDSLINDELQASNQSQTSGNTDVSHLAEKVEAFIRCADVRDRRYHGVKYKSCFIASDVIDNLVFAGVAKSRKEAVKLGRELQREIRVFNHVTNDHVFSDDYLFFRFRSGLSELQTNFNEAFSEKASTGGARSSETGHENLLAKAKVFREIADVRNRNYRLKTYENCFIATDQVDMMVQMGMASTRKNAVLLGRQLARELDLFSHVCDHHEFDDEHLFFRFNDGASGAGVGRNVNNQAVGGENGLVPTDPAGWMVTSQLEPVPEIDSNSMSLSSKPLRENSKPFSESTGQSSSLTLDEAHRLAQEIESSARRLSEKSVLSANQKALVQQLLDITEDLDVFE